MMIGGGTRRVDIRIGMRCTVRWAACMFHVDCEGQEGNDGQGDVARVYRSPCGEVVWIRRGNPTPEKKQDFFIWP